MELGSIYRLFLLIHLGKDNNGKEEAFKFARRAAKEEGIFVGISSGASLAAVNQKLGEIPEGSKILTFSYDTGERYLSIEGLFEA